MNASLFRSAKDAQDTARTWRRWANDYDDKWRAKCRAEASRIYLDALLWLRLARTVNLGQTND